MERATILGHDRAVAAFKDRLTRGTLPHAWLISGPKGIGKASLAKHVLAEAVLGRSRDPSTAANAPVHPDLSILASSDALEAGRARIEIPVDSVRDLSRFLRLTSAGGGRRVAIIDAADEMNINAQNALLKILEEPPANAMLLLISHAESRLLPTIRSRCARLPLRPLSADRVLAIVTASLDLKPEERHSGSASRAADIARGCPGLALALLESGAIELADKLATAAVREAGAAEHGTAMNRLGADPACRAGAAHAQRFELGVTAIKDAVAAALKASIRTGGSPVPHAGCTPALWREMLVEQQDFLAAFYGRITYLAGAAVRANLDRASILSEIASMWRLRTRPESA